MIKYRICKNKYDYFGVQRFREPLKLFNKFTILRGKWVCGAYSYSGSEMKFNNLHGARDHIKRCISMEKKNNDDWTCVSPVYNK